MEQSENKVFLRGELVGLPTLSHENHRKRFFRFFVSVARLSGTVDVLPVIAEEQILNAMDLSAGDMLEIEGQIRSHNLKENGQRRLLVFVFAASITVTEGAPANQVLLQGPLCRIPNLRRTPLGREICDVMVAVPRHFHRADYLPCILWGRTAQEISRCATGDIIRMEGRLQSRIYTKQTEAGAEERTAYEVSALTAEILQKPI